MKTRKFDIGKMRHRIRVYNVDQVDDGSGGFDRGDPDPSDLLTTVWCHIEPVTARERQWGEQYTELTTHRCWLRYNDQLAEGQTWQRDVGGTTINYYVEQLYDPDNLQEFHLAMLREGGPM